MSVRTQHTLPPLPPVSCAPVVCDSGSANFQPTPGGVFPNPSPWSCPLNSEPQTCGFCSDPGHFICHCPVVMQYAQQGKVLRNTAGKVTLPDGWFLPHNVPQH